MTPEQRQQIRQAIGDPGSFLARGNDYTEQILDWEVRAVEHVLTTMAGKADWRYDPELGMHIPCCTVKRRWPVGPEELSPMLPCGNGPLVGEQILVGDCGQHEGVSSAP